VASTNAQIEAIVQAAKAAAAEGRSYDAVAALVQITAISAVQQQDLASAVSQLAAKVANDPTLDIAAEAATLEKVC
jgi:hypothetical protein